MQFRSVAAVFFSATGTNARTVKAIAAAIDEHFRTMDLTVGRAGGEERFSRDDLVVIGAPVYGGRIYRGASERFRGLRGDDTPCIVTVTYGNRHYDDALLELKDQMKAQGFRVIAGAALVGEHTYGDIQKGRPDESDLAEDREFAEKVLEKWEKGCESEPEIPGNFPYKDGGGGGRFRPLTDEKCIHCLLCVRNCPEGAIAGDCVTIDDGRCISCFRCIRNCPVHAKNMKTKEYLEFAEGFTRRLAARRGNEYYL